MDNVGQNAGACAAIIQLSSVWSIDHLLRQHDTIHYLLCLHSAEAAFRPDMELGPGMSLHTLQHYDSLTLSCGFAGSLVGRKLQQLDLGSLGALPAMDMSDVGQNAMQNPLQVRAGTLPFLKVVSVLSGTLAKLRLDMVLHFSDVVAMILPSCVILLHCLC